MRVHCIGCGKAMDQGDPAPALPPLCKRCILSAPDMSLSQLEQAALLHRRESLLNYLERLYAANTAKKTVFFKG